MRVTDNTAAAIVDPVSGLPEVELVSVDVNWQLFEAGGDEKNRKPLTQGNAFGKASIDSGYQRFARARADSRRAEPFRPRRRRDHSRPARFLVHDPDARRAERGR